MMDIRRYSEHVGTFDDAYNFFHESGHIPNAVWPGDWVDLVDIETGKLKNLDEIQDHWKSLGINLDDEPLVFYCGTGWRSTIGFFAAYLLGIDAKNYDDSFYGWTEKKNRIDFERLINNKNK